MSTEKPTSTEAPKLASVLSEAQSIIQAAEARARDLQAQAQRVHDEAREEGYRKGYDQGYRDAVSSAVRLLEDTATLGDRLAHEAAKLATAIASYIIGEHVRVAPNAVKKFAIRALQESVVGESARIAVNPDDEAVVKGALDDLRRIAGGAPVEVEVDSQLTRGGCVVRTSFGEVDASVEALVKAVASRLGVRNNEK